MAPRKTSTTGKTRVTTPRKTAKTIRNLRGCVVHLRLFSQSPKDPYRIALNPRGQNGDFVTVPASLADDPTLSQAIDRLVEVITPAEARALLDSYGPVGYLGRTDAPQIIRPDDTTIVKVPDWDGKGRLPQDRPAAVAKRNEDQREFSTGMHTADVPGSDQALHQMLQQEAKRGQTAMPPEATFDRSVKIERASGDRNI